MILRFTFLDQICVAVFFVSLDHDSIQFDLLWHKNTDVKFESKIVPFFAGQPPGLDISIFLSSKELKLQW